MSTSLATSPDSGHSVLRTPPRRQDPPAKPLAKSSPVGKVYQYYLPENREQYQNLGFDESFLLGTYTKSQFVKFLNVMKLPESIPNLAQRERTQENFITFANKMAKFIKKWGEHFLFLYLALLPT